MGKRTAAIVLALAALGVIWATRWLLLWEFALAFHPPKTTWLVEGSIPADKMDWQDHLALAVAAGPPWESGRPRANGFREDVDRRLKHVQEALETCLPQKRPVLNAVAVGWDNRLAHGLPRLDPQGKETREEERRKWNEEVKSPESQAGFTRLAQAALKAQQAEPDNGYLDMALAYAAFGREDDEAGMRYLLVAATKPFRTYYRECLNAVRRAMIRARAFPIQDPLFCYLGEDIVNQPSLLGVISLDRYASHLALTYARAGELDKAERLLRALLAVGERMQEGASLNVDRWVGRATMSHALLAYREITIRYRNADEAVKVSQKVDQFWTGSGSAHRWPDSSALEAGIDYWGVLGVPLLRASVGMIRLLPVVIILLIVLRLSAAQSGGGIAEPPSGTRLTLLVALAPPLLLIAMWPGPIGSVRDWPAMVPPLRTQAGFLWTLGFLALVARLGVPDVRGVARRSGVLRVLLAVLGTSCVCGGALVLLSLSPYFGADGAGTDVILPYGLLGLALLGVGIAALGASLPTGVGALPDARGEPDAAPEKEPRTGRQMAGLLYWLLARTLVAGLGLVFFVLLFHFVFLVWLGGSAAQHVAALEGSTTPIVRFEF